MGSLTFGVFNFLILFYFIDWYSIYDQKLHSIPAEESI